MQSSGKSFVFRSAVNIAAWIGIAGLSAIAMFFTWSWSARNGYANLDSVSIRQLELYAAGLESELGKHEYLPSIVGLDEDVLALLKAPGDTRLREKANKRLASLNARASSVAIFVMDTSGIVQASSDSYKPKSFVGMDFSSKPYFADAIQGGQARFFAANPTRDAPEYHFAQPIRHKDRVLGVAVVNISLDPMEATWIASTSHSHSEKFLIVDENDVIIMASSEDWKYKKTAMLSSMLRTRLKNPGQDPARTVEPLGLSIERPLDHGALLVRLPATAGADMLYVTQERFMVRTGWHLVTLSDASDVLLNARNTAFGAGALAAFVGLLGMYLVQRRRAIAGQLAARAALQRAHDGLELRIAERTAELNQTNQELVREIGERKHAEQVLREAQDELVQASKLALLGQMAAGITHEINQPLTALRSLSHNTQLLLKRGSIERIDKNLQSIADLTERMGRITGQLKSFARKAPPAIGPVLLSKAVENALLLLENRIHTEQVALKVDLPDQLWVHCDGNRLEQVLINLFANALDAMKDSASRMLAVEAWTAQDRVVIRISDCGSGIPEAAMEHLFEPFFSTKPPGKGLGLGLAISAGIVREFGGVLRAENVAGGAAFEFDLKTEESINV